MADEKTETATAPAATEAVASDGKFATVTLQQPITRGGSTIEEVQLRKPKAGELRGLSLQDLMTADADAVIKLAPRISNPILTAAEVADMEVDDFAQLAGAIVGFFMTPEQRRMVDQMGI